MSGSVLTPEQPARTVRVPKRRRAEVSDFLWSASLDDVVEADERVSHQPTGHVHEELVNGPLSARPPHVVILIKRNDPARLELRPQILECVQVRLVEINVDVKQGDTVKRSFGQSGREFPRDEADPVEVIEAHLLKPKLHLIGCHF